MAKSVIETDRLVLVPWGAEHTEVLARLSSIPEVMTFIASGDVWSRAKAEEVAGAAVSTGLSTGSAGARPSNARVVIPSDSSH